MALLYVEQLEDLDVEEMQKTHEDEIKLLNEVVEKEEGICCWGNSF